MMMALLFMIVGCLSDDNEGTFELPTKTVTSDEIPGTSTETTDISAGTTDGLDNFEIVSVINGSAAGIRIMEPATVYVINAAGLMLSTSVSSNGSFILVDRSMTAPFVLFLVPGNSSDLNWQGEIQARIIVTAPTDNIEVNPIFTAVALSIFQENGFDLFAFAQATIEDSANALELLEQFKSILSSTDETNLNSTLNGIVASWGTTSAGDNIISSDLFSSSNYAPRKTMRGMASADHLFIEALSVKFGATNLAQKLVDNVNSNTLSGGIILDDAGFQEGLVFTIYSLNKYQPFLSAEVWNILDTYLTPNTWYAKKYLQPYISTYQYAITFQSIVDNLIAEEIGFDKSEDEIKTKIKSIIASRGIISFFNN